MARQRNQAQDEPDQAQDETENPYAGLSDEGHNEFAADLLEDAKVLQDEKHALLSRIGDNRDALRLVARSGHVSEVQAKAIDLFYPPRKPKGETTEETPEAVAA